MKNQAFHATYVLTATLMLNMISVASASPISLMDPFYQGRYVLTDLGAPPGLPGGIGGLALKEGLH